MNAHPLKYAQSDPGRAAPHGGMKFWNKALPDPFYRGDDPGFPQSLVKSNTGWLDGAAMEPLGATQRGPPPVAVNWGEASVPVPERPTTLAQRLAEMANSYEWDLPAAMLAPVAQARRALKENPGFSATAQQDMIQASWPEVWKELRLYERRRLLAEAEQGVWAYQTPPPWPHTRFESAGRAMDQLEKRMDQVNARSYVADPDPLLEQPAVDGLKSFLPSLRGDAPFRIG